MRTLQAAVLTMLLVDRTVDPADLHPSDHVEVADHAQAITHTDRRRKLHFGGALTAVDAVVGGVCFAQTTVALGFATAVGVGTCVARQNTFAKCVFGITGYRQACPAGARFVATRPASQIVGTRSQTSRISSQ